MTAPSDLERALDAYRHALLHHDEMGGCDPNDCEVWEDEKAAARAAVLSALPTKAQIDRMIANMLHAHTDGRLDDVTALGSQPGLHGFRDEVMRRNLTEALYRAAGIEGEG